MTLAACLMVRNEVVYLAEWLAFHNLMGVSHFRIYDNGSDDGTAELLDRLAGHFNIERIAWSVPGNMRQVTAFDDAAKALAGRAEFVAFLDADEFLFDSQFRPLPAVLAGFGEEISGIAVNQVVFGSSGLTEAGHDLVIRRFIQRAPDEYHEHFWVKSILRPDRVAEFQTSHTARLAEGAYALADGAPFRQAGRHPAQVDRVARHGLVLHHYILKSLAEFRLKQRRGAVSDRPADRFVRLTEAYFSKRDILVNAVRDRRLADLASMVQSRIDLAMFATLPNSGSVPDRLAIGRQVDVSGMKSLHGFHRPDRSGLCWMRHGERSTVVFEADSGAAALQIRGYLIAPGYPVDALEVELNGVAVPAASLTLEQRWFTMTTDPVVFRAGLNLLDLRMPYFVPVRHTNPKALDRRSLAAAIASLTIVRGE